MSSSSFDSFQPSYAFNASAAGFGGVIRRGDKTTTIPTVASVCISSAGGEASTTVDNYDRDDISFTRAQSRVSGYATRNGDTVRHFTYSDVYITNLKIFDRVKVALMQATVNSTREINLKEENPLVEMQPDRTQFSVRLIYRGIEIDGEEFSPDIDLELCQTDTYARFAEMAAARRNLHIPKALKGFLDRLTGGRATEDDKIVSPADRPPIGGPLVKFDRPDKAKGNRVHLPKFGRARFADLVVKPDRQRLSLLRLNLDSSWQTFVPQQDERMLLRAPDGEFTAQADDPEDNLGGTTSAGDSGSNGVPIWT